MEKVAYFSVYKNVGGNFKQTMKPNFYLIVGIVFLMLAWLFTGIFRDDEFYELSIFCKFPPTFKIYFYSSTEQSALTLKSLSFWYLPLILIQSTLTFMTFGFYKHRLSFNFQKWQLPTHFITNLILTTLLVELILFLDKTVLTILLSFLIFLSNYFIISLLTGRQRVQELKAKKCAQG
jgi:hypothetical protein